MTYREAKELNPCPKCGRRPLLGYACGEYFIVSQVEECVVCNNFREMHATKEQEAEAWNRRTKAEAYADYYQRLADTYDSIAKYGC